MVIEPRERVALRPNEAAAWLGVSRDTVDRLVKRGELRRIKIGAAVLIETRELRRHTALARQRAAPRRAGSPCKPAGAAGSRRTAIVTPVRSLSNPFRIRLNA
jgi:excisionase family DNA binding protein